MKEIAKPLIYIAILIAVSVSAYIQGTEVTKQEFCQYIEPVRKGARIMCERDGANYIKWMPRELWRLGSKRNDYNRMIIERVKQQLRLKQGVVAPTVINGTH